MSPKAKRPKSKSVDLSKTILADYREKMPLYKDFATTCKSLIEQLLRREKIRVHSVTCRTKDVDRLRDKLARPEKQYAALTDVTDLAGIRIITYFSDDVDSVGTVVEKEFDIILEESIDKRKALDPDRFGYISLHYVCKLPRKRTRLAEYSSYTGYVCEIQVRSILQHAWAEIEHDLGYTVPEAIPRPIRRRFSRLAALLEITDDEFMRIRDELTDYAAEVEKDIVDKPSEVLLDKVSLTALIEQDVIVQRMDEHMADYVGAVLEVGAARWLNDLVSYLRHSGIQGIEELKTALAKRERVVQRQFEIRLEGEKRASLSRGISLFHLWQVLLAERGSDELRTAFERFHLGIAEGRRKRTSRIVDIVRNIAAGGD